MTIGGMSPIDLQNCLIAELTQLFSDQLFQKPKKKETDPDVQTSLTWYPQDLPMQDGYEWDKYVPYGIVQLKKGKHPEETEPMDVMGIVYLCLYNDGSQNIGGQEIINAIEKIRQHFFKKHIISGKYSIRFPFEWEMADEELWPYFMAGVETHWALPIICAEDPNL